MSDQPDNKQIEAKPVDTDDHDEGEVLQWTTHPVRRNRLKAVVVTLFITLVAVITWYATDTFGFGLLALVVLFASIARYYFPTTYRLSDRRIRIKTITQTIYKEWSVYRSYYPDKSGILLSPFLEPSRLENFRGIYLIFSDNREEVIDFIKARINRGESSEDDQARGEGPE